MGADQVAVVDIGVVDVLPRLHLRLQLLDDVALADQVMGELDAGDGGERLGASDLLIRSSWVADRSP